MDNSTLDLEDELDSFDVDNSLRGVAAVASLDNLKSYKDIVRRKYHISTFGAAKLISNAMFELQAFIAFTPAMIRPTQSGEMLRQTYIESIETLDVLRSILISMHYDDEGYSDILVESKNDRNKS
jgi:hypothetical protein